MDPPLSQEEWAYLAGMTGSPQYFREHEFAVYNNKICRGCSNERLMIKTKAHDKIRDRGGLETMRPIQRVLDEYEEEHGHELRANRAAMIHGLESATAIKLNGVCCKLVFKSRETHRWTVELLSGEQRAIKEGNLECSSKIDEQYKVEKARFLMANREALDAEMSKKSDQRPLGEHTSWAKVPGIHPGAVVRLKNLKAAPELNGCIARCLTFDADAQRWEVDLGAGHKKIKQENLEPAPAEKAPTFKTGMPEKAKSPLTEAEKHAMDYGWDG